MYLSGGARCSRYGDQSISFSVEVIEHIFHVVSQRFEIIQPKLNRSVPHLLLLSISQHSFDMQQSPPPFIEGVFNIMPARKLQQRGSHQLVEHQIEDGRNSSLRHKHDDFSKIPTLESNNQRRKLTRTGSWCEPVKVFEALSSRP